MSEDFLANYQKLIFQSFGKDEKTSQTQLLNCSHNARLSTYLLYLQSLSKCSNETTCLILEEKLKQYSCLVDDRKGINNFASVAKSLATNNVTNLSKKWTCGLVDSLSDLSVEKMLIECESSGHCENSSSTGCTATQPSPQFINTLFTTLSHIRGNRSKVPELAAPSRSVLHGSTWSKPSNVISTEAHVGSLSTSHVDSMKKKSSLYSSYDENHLGRINFENRTSKHHQDIRFKPSPSGNGPPWKNAISKTTYDDINSSSMIAADDYNGSSKRFDSGGRINKLSKYLKHEDQNEDKKPLDLFKTATETLKIQNEIKHRGGKQYQYQNTSYGNQSHVGVKKSLGGKGIRASSNRFVPPLRQSQEENSDMLITRSILGQQGDPRSGQQSSNHHEEEEDERLRHLDPKMVELIRSEIMDHGANITWDDIAGLEFAKHTIQEIVVWPMLRPDIFTGLRRPPKGILLFGPPGTGKTLIGKCIASQSKSTFFSISASSLTSKWIGDGEKMVRALFAVARVEQPSVVFIDEIDSLLSQRSDQEHESSRRIKTEFLVQLDGAATGDDDRILIIGATNRPQELDEAARRRLVKRLYIPLPDSTARKQLVSNLMSKERNCLSHEDIVEIAVLTEGYSGADMKNLCQEACLGPIRSLSASLIAHIDADQVRAVEIDDFKEALKRVRSSVSNKDLDLYIAWDKQFGMSS